MPSVALIDRMTEQFSDQEPERHAEHNLSPKLNEPTGHVKSNIAHLFATIKSKPSSISSSGRYLSRNYSHICNYFNNIDTVIHQPKAKVEEVKKIYLKKDTNQHYNEQLVNDRALFTPGKVSQMTEKFQKQCIKPSFLFPQSSILSKLNDTTPHSIESNTQENNQIDELETSVTQSLCPETSYSWVFGNAPKTVCDLAESQTPLPVENTIRDIYHSKLQSFKQTEEHRGGILNEVLTCNVIDQQTCDWRSVKKELKSNLCLKKLKPVAVIDPLTLPVKMNGIDKVDRKDAAKSPSQSKMNVDVMNERLAEQLDDDYCMKKVLLLEESEIIQKESKIIQKESEIIQKEHNRPLSPIWELEDSHSSILSASSDHSSFESTEFFTHPRMNSIHLTRMNSFCISPEDLYPRGKYEIDENGNLEYLEEFESVSLSIETGHSSSISLPLNFPLNKCTSECQVHYLYLFLV